MLALGEVFSLHHSWLGARQAVVSENIAHAATPGFRARDVPAFAEALVRMRTGGDVSVGIAEIDRDALWAVRSNGNSVSVEQELIRASEVRRDAQMNAALTKAFHRMFLMGAKA